ncbi:hypothetical protein [Actinocrispum wychmicini]|uniref:Lipoprotein n=1 Tax=Actinocrispum wychmicini TaxID=1213861 RepID=A0A4R2KES7_9PSEU|nr:hypothetical protein [Actinocrispum wychmicini]TCO65055.1 hypothetical protein EV192_101839 [Actinocrispum wychmicini]
MTKYLVMVLLLAACGAPDSRPPSPAEAQRLAHIRSMPAAAITARVPTGAGVVVLTGRVDFANRVGDTTMTTEGRTDPAATGLLHWDRTELTFQGWTRPLRRDGSELDTTLLLLASLHTAGPDDPAALRRTVTWLRSTQLNGTPVDVFQGDHLTYWVDPAGNLRRLEAHLAGNSAPAVVDVTP